jgi:hypothetical protein
MSNTVEVLDIEGKKKLIPLPPGFHVKKGGSSARGDMYWNRSADRWMAIDDTDDIGLPTGNFGVVVTKSP